MNVKETKGKAVSSGVHVYTLYRLHRHIRVCHSRGSPHVHRALAAGAAVPTTTAARGAHESTGVPVPVPVSATPAAMLLRVRCRNISDLISPIKTSSGQRSRSLRSSCVRHGVRAHTRTAV